MVERLGNTDSQVLVLLDACRDQLDFVESYGSGKAQAYVPMRPRQGVKVVYSTDHAFSAYAELNDKYSRFNW